MCLRIDCTRFYESLGEKIEYIRWKFIKRFRQVCTNILFNIIKSCVCMRIWMNKTRNKKKGKPGKTMYKSEYIRWYNITFYGSCRSIVCVNVYETWRRCEYDCVFFCHLKYNNNNILTYECEHTLKIFCGVEVQMCIHFLFSSVYSHLKCLCIGCPLKICRCVTKLTFTCEMSILASAPELKGKL